MSDLIYTGHIPMTPGAQTVLEQMEAIAAMSHVNSREQALEYRRQSGAGTFTVYATLDDGRRVFEQIFALSEDEAESFAYELFGYQSIGNVRAERC